MTGPDWPFAPFAPFGFDLIVADPPWLVEMRTAKGETKAPQAHYSCMPIEAISALPVGHLAAPDCWLLLWTSAPLLDRAFDVMRDWGFTYTSRIAWRKCTVNDKTRVGPGYVVRTMHEDVLIGKIGKPPLGTAFPSFFDGLAREHSRKPEEFYALVDRFAPDARKLDLFSRQNRPGWDSWGFEVGKFDEGAV